jgi:hypothetical protein
MDKIMRLMVVFMHNLKTLTCMVMDLMQGTPITSNQKQRNSRCNRRWSSSIDLSAYLALESCKFNTEFYLTTSPTFQ